MNLHPLLQQVHTIGRSANTPDERAIRSSVTAAELRLWSKTHLAPERMTCRAAPQRAKRGGYLFGEWRGTAPQPQADAPRGVCDRHMEDDERFVFSGWIVHRIYAVESAEGAADGGTTGLGWPFEEGQGHPVGDHSSSRKEYRGST